MPEKKIVQPLEIQGLADMHCHCDYSIDARGTVDEYCEAALARGLAELCFTTHYDANPQADGDANFIRVRGEKRPATVENLAAYVDDVLRVQEQYYPLGLSVKLGLEVGWYPGCEREVEQLKHTYPFEYLLCGIHELDNICFCCANEFERCFDRYSAAEMVKQYFADMIIAARSGLFDTIAHPDYYRKYAEQYYGIDKVRDLHRPHVEALAQALKDGSTALEVNTAALRKGLADFYPQADLLNALKRADVEILHLGSDAHAPSDVGYEFDAASALIPMAMGGCDD